MWKRMGTALVRNLFSKNFLLCMVAALLFRIFFFGSSVVRGSSMNPGVRDGDRIFVLSAPLAYWEIKRGDVVVFDYPLNSSLSYIKRVIGVPGDRIEMRDGNVWLNGEELTETLIMKKNPQTESSFVIPSGCYYVLGDNRPYSGDSREFGLVAKHFIESKAEFRIWPPNRIGFIR